MPAISQAQRRLMFWAKANPKAAAKRGIKPSVAKEFTQADKGGKLPERVSRGEKWYAPKD
jgi:hypothetical protein